MNGDADGGSSAEQGFEPAKESAWRWQFSDDADVAMDLPAPSFASQQAAEAWLTDNYADLADDGVAAVSLFDGEHVAYGPMSLAPDDAAGAGAVSPGDC